MDNKKHQKFARKQGGWSLWELLAGAVITALIAGYVIPLLDDARDTGVLVNREIAKMKSTISSIGSRYFDENITTNMDNEELIRGNNIKGFRSNASNEIFNSFDGKITITGVDENGYEWQSEKIPAGVCAKLVDEARSLNTFEEVQIGSSTLQYSTSQSNDFTQACETAAGTNDSLTVTWIKSTS